MGIINTFPPEMLTVVFEVATFDTVIAASHVCRQWRAVAINNKDLWHTLGINRHSIKHTETLSMLFKRSKQRSMCLGFDLMMPPTDFGEFRHMLQTAVTPHLWRCSRLFIYARRETWVAILGAFAGQKFPSLQVLDIADHTPLPPFIPAPQINPPPPMNHPAILPPGAQVMGLNPVAHATPVPLRELLFPLPPNHPVRIVELSGISLGAIPLPELDALNIKKNLPSIVDRDGRMNRWLMDYATEVSIKDLCIPPMHYPQNNSIFGGHFSNTQFLTLRQLRATPRAIPDEDGWLEYDCRPFFCSVLTTPYLRYLEIDRLDIIGRAWDDFLDALPQAQNKYPCLEELVLCEAHFTGMSYVEMAAFFGCLPVLWGLELYDSFQGAWEMVMETLELDPELCPCLKEVRVNDEVLVRFDPLPFREVAFGYGPAFGEF
ncbi:hypothetical protein B0H10DRAFT_2126155 [Mycena sp. CBHHK59/15]|nr:hypothetical protein B0H10DRAFT_2126155 [Mycena sp. CBHHK59/15]